MCPSVASNEKVAWWPVGFFKKRLGSFYNYTGHLKIFKKNHIVYKHSSESYRTDVGLFHGEESYLTQLGANFKAYR